MLRTLRFIFLSFTLALLMFLVVLATVTSKSEQRSPTTFLALTIAAGVVGLSAVIWNRSRPLQTNSLGAVAQSYMTVSFLSIAFAELPALMGFVGSFITGALWVYLVGLAFTAVGFAMCAPTAAEIRRRDEQLAGLGSPYLLSAALTQPRMPGARG